MWPFRRKMMNEQECLRITERDAITYHQLFEGVLGIGGIGSGKTTTMAHLMAAIMRRGHGMLILTSKSTDIDDIRRIAERECRLHDVIEVAPGKACFDPITHELTCRGGSVAAASQYLTDLVDFSTKTSSQQNDEPVWPQTSARQLRMAMTIIHHATGQCDAMDLYRFVASMPTSMADVRGVNPDGTPNTWRSDSYCCRMLSHAVQLSMTQDVEIAGDFILDEWPRLSDKTASSVKIYSTNLLEKLISGTVRELVNGASTVSPDDVLRGRIVAVNTPALVYREPGQLVQLCWKLSTIRTALRRNLSENDLPICIWADEAQMHALPSVDSSTQAVARSHKLINVAITQNIPLLETLLKRREDVLAWLSNLQTKFVFANADKDTNDYFSALFGNSKHLFGGMSSTSAPFDLVSDWMGNNTQQTNCSMNEQWHPDVPPQIFSSGAMRKGGRENAYWVDCFVHQAGRSFSTGKPFVKAAIRQYL